MRITAAELRAADEVFLSSTTAQITPVGAVDGHRIGDGQCGPVTARIYAAFRQSVTARPPG
jgi:branched-subunit amino acid aminotransferase/4-amino-4-deoxychorismate lyase